MSGRGLLNCYDLFAKSISYGFNKGLLEGGYLTRPRSEDPEEGDL
jgi:hypothetical protein